MHYLLRITGCQYKACSLRILSLTYFNESFNSSETKIRNGGVSLSEDVPQKNVPISVRRRMFVCHSGSMASTRHRHVMLCRKNSLTHYLTHSLTHSRRHARMHALFSRTLRALRFSTSRNLCQEDRRRCLFLIIVYELLRLRRGMPSFLRLEAIQLERLGAGTSTGR